MSTVSRFLVEHQEHYSITSLRRRNFNLLLEYFKETDEDMVPLIASLPEGVCPLLFPVKTPDSLSLYQFLRAAGVEVVRFWRFFHVDHPQDRFPFETELKKA